MSRYRKIDSRLWNDAKFRSLSDDGKLLFLMLLTHPQMTPLGAMRATMGGLAEEMGWLPERLRAAFAEPFSRGMANHDPEAHFLCLPNFLKYNQPENPNVLKSWAGSLDALPECALKTQTIQTAKAFAKAKSEAFAKAFQEAFGGLYLNPTPKQEQEQEPEQEPLKSLSREYRDSGLVPHARTREAVR